MPMQGTPKAGMLVLAILLIATGPLSHPMHGACSLAVGGCGLPASSPALPPQASQPAPPTLPSLGAGEGPTAALEKPPQAPGGIPSS